MIDDKLSGVFKSYIGNRDFVSEITTHLDAVIGAFLLSPYGNRFQNVDRFYNHPVDHDVSTLSMKKPDKHNSTSELTINILAEGRIIVSAAWFAGSDLEEKMREERELHFTAQENAESIASRIISALSDMNENHVAEAFRNFANEMVSATFENGKRHKKERVCER